MVETKTSIFFSLINFVIFTSCVTLPPSIVPCHRSDPQIDECITSEAKKMFKLVMNGYPELGFPSFKPLQLHDFTITNGIDGLTINATNGLVTGLTDHDLKDFKMNLEKKTMSLQLIHNMYLDCKYNTRGRLLAIPIQGKGNLRVSTKSLKWTMMLKWELVKGRNNKEHIRIKKSKIKYEVDLVQFKFDGLLNREIDLAMNNLLNENWRDVVADLGDPSLQVLQKMYTDMINSFLTKVSYDDLFPL